MKAKAFTLVELLAVVAIISLLVAMLMPSLAKAKARAREAACLVQVSDMGRAGTLYAQDYPCYPPDLQTPSTAWPVAMLPYVGNNPAMFNCPDGPEVAKWDGKIWSTPYYYTPFDYAVCCWGSSDSSYLGYWVPAGRLPARKPEEIAKPSDFYWIADSNCGLAEDPTHAWDFIFEVHVNDWCAPIEWPGMRHRGGVNMLYFDGHAQWLLRADMMKAGTSTKASERDYWRRKVNFDNQPHNEYNN